MKGIIRIVVIVGLIAAGIAHAVNLFTKSWVVISPFRADRFRLDGNTVIQAAGGNL